MIMQEYKLNWRFWFFLLLFLDISILLISIIPSIITDLTVIDPKTDAEGENIILIAFIIILPIYLLTVITMFYHYFRYNGHGLEITNNGIENTYVFTLFLAFGIFVPVKLIPWEAITKYSNENDLPVISVNPKMIKANFIAKFILTIINYNFCYSFVKPKINKEDIEKYSYKFKITPN